MTIDQLRAADALEKANKAHDDFGDGDRGADYRAYVTRIGPAILTNGLGQALATESAAAGPDATDENPHRRLFDNLASWLTGPHGPYENNDIFAAITEEDFSSYRIAQAEALAWLSWHVKFCRALFPKRESE